MIPQNFKEWYNCITKGCKIELTKTFAKERLNVYQNNENPETQKFLKLYGQQHLNNIINWYKQI